MDIEELNKFQIVLLVTLVSFVTSIATGIVTVTLLAQAPPAVTQTINQVVERTIQTVLPSATSTVSTTVKETTVIVKEDDLITTSIAQSLLKTGRVFAGLSTTTPVVGLAAQMAPGFLVTDSSIVDKEHLVVFKGGSGLFTVSQRFPEIGIAILTPKNASTSLATAFKIGDVGAIKLGATTIALVSITQERVAVGAASGKSTSADVLNGGKQGATTPVRNVDTTITANLVPGTPLVNVFGDLVGISTAVSEQSGNGTFIAVSDILSLLKAPQDTATPKK